MKSLILGGVRSGKSRLAERLAIESGLPVTYLATATAGDEEMAARIAAHQARRPADWQLVEEPYRLATVLRRQALAGHCVVVECLTLWLTNLLTARDPALFEVERSAFIELLPSLAGRVILVGNESNLGITPMDQLSRRYCDESGRLHQDLAQICEQVFLTVAGLPQQLKGDTI